MVKKIIQKKVTQKSPSKKTDVIVVNDYQIEQEDERDIHHLEPEQVEADQEDHDDDFFDDHSSPSDLLPVLSPSSDIVLPSKDVSTNISDPLVRYIKDITRYPLLTHEEELKLTNELALTGDIEVAKKLVVANLRLVVKIAMEYKSTYQNVLDLIQEGNIGLMKAVSKYDQSKGAKLSYYASWWIRSYILKYILDNFRLVKVGTTQEQKKIFYNLMREKDRLEKLGIKPEAKIISDRLGVSEKAVAEMDQRLSQTGGEISLDRQVDQSSDGGSRIVDFLQDTSKSVDDQLGDAQGLEILNQHLKQFVDDLKPRDKEVFIKRLLSEVPISLQAIADEYGVSRERIRQIEERLIQKLKVYMSEYIR
jgi:RNA polymerase sigma-32 factor